MKREDAGMPKLWLMHRALMLRREHPEWFGAEAAYEPLPASGAKAAHVMAYLRGGARGDVRSAMAIKLGGSWASTTVDAPEGRWTNVLTGDEIGGRHGCASRRCCATFRWRFWYRNAE